MNTDCRALELWGKNLQSTVGEKFTRVELAMIKLPPFQFSVIIGLIISDCWLGFASNRHKNVHLQFQQSKANSEYLWFVEGARARAYVLRRGEKSPPHKTFLFYLITVIFYLFIVNELETAKFNVLLILLLDHYHVSLNYILSSTLIKLK